jgi:hypothetical protein
MLRPSVKIRLEQNGWALWSSFCAFVCARRIVLQLTPARINASTNRSSRRSRKVSEILFSSGLISPCQTASECRTDSPLRKSYPLIHRRIFPVEIRVSRAASGTAYSPALRRFGVGACTNTNEAAPIPGCNKTLATTDQNSVQPSVLPDSKCRISVQPRRKNSSGILSAVTFTRTT